MRTSGKDTDFVLFMVPVAVLTVLTIIWFGGPSETIQALDSSVTEAVAWVRSRL